MFLSGVPGSCRRRCGRDGEELVAASAGTRSPIDIAARRPVERSKRAISVIVMLSSLLSV